VTADRETIRKIERETMAVFTRVNPTRRDYTVGDTDFEGLRKREETILANLGLCPNDFAGRRVLDAGCGTGEIALLTASWGATVEAFDLNPASVKHAAKMAIRSGLNARCRFAVGSVLAPPVRGPFDIAMCLGVLPHVGDPRSGYANLAKLVRPGGYLYVSTINRYGFALRRAKRALVHLLSLGDPARKAEWAQVVWRRHIERAARFGHRTKDQIAWDNFVAPHLTASVADWLDWMNKNELEYVSSFPCFFSLRLPSSQAGGIQSIERTPPPEPQWLRSIVALAVQVRWALAFRVGGLASISFLGRKRAKP
jgi:2-polyprenyl-6-hydroxyphenyl methylase/3-demethylubiquinone-9 3-methyltransferase